MSITTGILLFDGVEELDFAGPWEVFAMAASIDRLRDEGNVTVHEHVRYVRDGNLVTSAGVSAGIDMALWLVGQIYGEEHARVTQYAMEYEPAPPYAVRV